MIPKPFKEWLYTGSWPFSVLGILPFQMEHSQSKSLQGFKFCGSGWYEDFKVLVEETGQMRNGMMTYRLSWYETNPAPLFKSLFKVKIEVDVPVFVGTRDKKYIVLGE